MTLVHCLSLSPRCSSLFISPPLLIVNSNINISFLYDIQLQGNICKIMFFYFFVFHRKIPRDLTEASLSGGGLSIMAALFMMFLFGMVSSQLVFLWLLKMIFMGFKGGGFFIYCCCWRLAFIPDMPYFSSFWSFHLFLSWAFATLSIWFNFL